mgnify:CR=1 FL=1
MPGWSKWNKIQLQVWTRDNWKCSQCGTDKKLCVHHKDKSGDWWKQKKANNELSNLQTLCLSCHAKHHWKEAKEKGVLNIYELYLVH